MDVSPLIIAFTPNYFIPAATTLKSILDSSSVDSRYEILCLVSEDIPERMQQKLRDMAGERMTFRYMNLRGRLKDVYIDQRYSEAASYRLILPDILPEYDSVMYIDCDVIVRNDLSKLYQNTFLGDNYLAVVYEAPIEGQAARFEALGCNSMTYFNSGFLIMNLDQMRKDNLTEKLLEASRVEYLEFPDQDVLNMVCQGRVLPLAPIYNSIRTFFLPQYKNEFLNQYSDLDWNAVQDHGTIHYTGGKPWNIFAVKFGEWWKTYYTLPQNIREEWTPNKRMVRLYNVYRIRIFGKIIDTVQSIYRRIK